MIILGVVGIFIGTLSAFFGIGGGMILTPILLILGFDIKTAIGISIIQMVFSSFLGSYLNFKKGLLVIEEGIFIGIGGFIGGFLGGYCTQYFSNITLEYILLFLILFAFYRMMYAFPLKDKAITKKVSKKIFFSLGVGIGIFSMTLGVGGAVLLTPFLVTIFKYPLKKAVSASLFFVLFSSIAGLISRLINGTIDFSNGLIVAIASLFGVLLGIYLKDYVSEFYHKKSLLLLYLLIILVLLDEIIKNML